MSVVSTLRGARARPPGVSRRVERSHPDCGAGGGRRAFATPCGAPAPRGGHAGRAPRQRRRVGGLPMDLVLPGNARVGLVNQGGRVEGVAGRQLRPATRGQSAPLPVAHRQPAFLASLLPGAPAADDLPQSVGRSVRHRAARGGSKAFSAAPPPWAAPPGCAGRASAEHAAPR